MPGLNLTRDEAQTRRDMLRVESYDIDLDFSAGGSTFDSITVIRFASVEPGGRTFVDLVATRVREITLNGRALDPDTAYADGRIALDHLDATNELRVVADCGYSNSGQGLHRTIDPTDGRTYLYTHFEVPDARRLYASFEQPDLKATFQFTITGPAGWTVLSNSPGPAPSPVREGVARWAFAPTPRISTYITAVIAGDYHVEHDSYTAANGQVIPLAVACRQSMAPHLDAANVFAITKLGFDYFIEKFDRPYPFEKYDQVFVPEYNIGAMENVACVTINEQYVFESKATDAEYQSRANTILHELAHMWFGDLVTMRWWDDLWLKESFATYVAFRCLADVTDWPAWTDFANSEKAWGLRQDELPSTHPIVADITDLDDVSVNFDGITYAKGAAVLKQLVAWVGSEEFFAGTKLYFDTYEWGNTTLADLLDALEKTSGRDLGAWSLEWLQTAGPNTLRPSFTVDDHGRFTAFEVLQCASEENPTLRSHRIAIGLYSLRDGILERTSQVSLDVFGPATAVDDLVGVPQPDLVLVNDDDLTYAKIRLDERSMATLRSDIGSFADSLPRALCWSAAWDMVRNAELPASEFIELVLRGIGHETSIGVIEDLHAWLTMAIHQFVAPRRRDAARSQVVAAARIHLGASEPAGDHQLAWARLFIRLAISDQDLSEVAALLDGSASIEGLDIDFDLRWALIGTLAHAGRFDAADIEAQLDRDRTTAATSYAAGARAARPTQAAKAEAWAAVTGRSDLPKGTLDAIGGTRRIGVIGLGLGFAQPDQVELIEPYVDPFFAVLEDVWASRTAENARSFVSGFYPRLIIAPDIVTRTDTFLASTSSPAALRRLLLEGRDDVVRALNAQAMDAS
jgi:aminopeptidase N